MQNAKDSFYEALRVRLAALNPERTIIVRGITRPGIAVDENEIASVADTPDCFHLNWTGMKVCASGALPLVTLECELRYATEGSSTSGGMDRGRALAAMDGELCAALLRSPRNAAKYDYSGLANGGEIQVMSTRVWWSSVVPGPLESKADRVGRMAKVQVMSYQEAGEL